MIFTFINKVFLNIVIDSFNIINLTFSEEYSNAIEEKQVAEQKLATAKLEAEAKLVEAEAMKKSNELLKQSLTDELIMKQFIEKWDGKLPQVMGESTSVVMPDLGL
jgi:regulator of protease activity HflC (stomatin/prohibitin superfamily)